MTKPTTLNLDSLPPLLRLSQTAELLSVSVWTLRNWDKKGILKPVRVGTRKDRRYKREDIIKILNQGIR